MVPEYIGSLTVGGAGQICEFIVYLSIHSYAGGQLAAEMFQTLTMAQQVNHRLEMEGYNVTGAQHTQYAKEPEKMEQHPSHCCVFKVLEYCIQDGFLNLAHVK
jgi:hypothetical protein